MLRSRYVTDGVPSPQSVMHAVYCNALVNFFSSLIVFIIEFFVLMYIAGDQGFLEGFVDVHVLPGFRRGDGIVN